MTIGSVTISKTTLNGILGFFIAMGCILQGLNSPLVSPKFNAALTMFLALARGVVGYLQLDADRLPAQTPGNPTSEPQAAHPVADDQSIAQK